MIDTDDKSNIKYTVQYTENTILWSINLFRSIVKTDIPLIKLKDGERYTINFVRHFYQSRIYI